MLTGLAYREYLTKRRLARAVAALADVSVRVVDAALSVGYQSHEAFTRAFKRKFTCVPQDWRKCRHPLEVQAG